MDLNIKRIIISTAFLVFLESITLLGGWISGLIPSEPRIVFAFLLPPIMYGVSSLDIYFKGSEKKRYIKIVISFFVFSGILILIPIIFYLLYQVGALELTIFNVLEVLGVITFVIYFIRKYNKENITGAN